MSAKNQRANLAVAVKEASVDNSLPQLRRSLLRNGIFQHDRELVAAFALRDPREPCIGYILLTQLVSPAGDIVERLGLVLQIESHLFNAVMPRMSSIRFHVCLLSVAMGDTRHG